MSSERPSPRVTQLEEGKRRLQPDLNKLYSLSDHGKFLKVRTPEQVDELLPVAQDLFSESIDRLEPFSQGSSLRDTISLVSEKLRKIARSNGRRTVEHYADVKGYAFSPRIEKQVKKSMWGETDENEEIPLPENAQKIVNGNAFWIVQFLKWQALHDLPELEFHQNPYAPLMDLLSFGAGNIKFHRDFVSCDFPIIKGGFERKLACIEQDNNNFREHNWDESCAQRIPSRTLFRY